MHGKYGNLLAYSHILRVVSIISSAYAYGLSFYKLTIVEITWRVDDVSADVTVTLSYSLNSNALFSCMAVSVPVSSAAVQPVPEIPR